MKIAIDARIIYTSTGRYVERLIKHLQEIDPANQYIILLLAKDFERWQPSAPNFTKVVADYSPYTLNEQINFARQLYGLRADIVHFTMPQQPLFYFRRHITTIHDLTLIDHVNKRNEGLVNNLYKHYLKPAVFKLVMRTIIKTSHHIITPTEYVKNQLTTRYPVKASKITVTFEAADKLTAEAEAYPPAIGKEYIFYVGNAYIYKNIGRLIEAFAVLHKLRPNLYLILAGKTDFFYQQLQQKVEHDHIQNIIFTDFISDENLGWLLQHAQLYVFPSLSEGFGLPGLEAMVQGTPVISSNASCLPEVYGSAASYFDPYDVADMAEKIDILLGDKAELASLKAAGLERVKMFSWEKMARETLEIYNLPRSN